MTKVAAFVDADGATLIQSEELAALLAGALDTPVKFGILNGGDEAFAAGALARIAVVGSSDGATQLRLAFDPVTLSPPWGLSGTVSGPSSGVWPGLGIKAAVVVAVNATGQTVRSVEATATISDLTSRITWAWQQVTGATGYRLYRSTTPGTYTTPSLIANEATLAGAGTVQFIDDGSSPAAGAPPATNTTAGAAPTYGTPPAMASLGTADVTLGALAVGRYAFIWVGRVVAPATTALGNKRFGAIEVVP